MGTGVETRLANLAKGVASLFTYQVLNFQAVFLIS